MERVKIYVLFAVFVLVLQIVSTFAHYNETKYQVNGFSWSNCGSSSDPIRINDLKVSPDPLRIPGNLSLGIDMVLSENITSPSAASIKVQKKVAFVWITIPCEKGAGSCDYKDFCDLWPIPKKCPQAYKKAGIPCKCPITANKYTIPLTPIMDLSKEPIPKWMENGEYFIRILISDPKGHRMTCTQAYFQLEADLK